MIKYTAIILIFILCGCGTQEKPKDVSTADSIASPLINKPRYTPNSVTTCKQDQLSKQFDIAIDFTRYSITDEPQDSCILKVLIKDKETKAYTDSIFLTSRFYSGETFANCKNTTSYSTGHNAKKQVVDNYAGDLVVADLNFDDRDDIAVINDMGGNGGPLYSYYIQSGNKKFLLDSFLTDSVAFFPTQIDKTGRKITTYVHAGACCMAEHVYELNRSTNKWKQVKHKIHGAQNSK